MEKFKSIEYKRGANPVQIFNEKFNPIHICQGSKVFEPLPDRNIQTKTGEVAFELQNGIYVCQINEAGWHEQERYSPFQLLSILRHKDNYRAAIQFVEMEYMNKPVPYIRVGTNYFKRIQKKNSWGVLCNEMKIWNKETIKDDYGKSFLKHCHQYDDFTIEPNNKHYKEAVRGMWNLYEPFPHEVHPEPVSVDEIPVSANFISHIFGEQAELGWKYMKVLFERPKQILPVLVLVSKERQTGKTSFLNWLDIIFANNYTVVAPEDLHSSFNSQYAYKNIIGVDEAVIDRKSAIEKIKSVATAKTIMVNQKMIAQYRIPFYGKIVITTNRENDFMRVDSEEIRFWVRKIGTIESDKMNDSFYDDLIKEVPKFLRYLQDQVDVEYGRSRMVFTYQEIHNEYIERVKLDSRSTLHKDIEIMIRDWFLDNQHHDELFLRIKDIKNSWFQNDSRIGQSYIKKVLNEEMQLESEPMARYQILGSGESKPSTPYRFLREDYVDSESESIDNDDVIPF